MKNFLVIYYTPASDMAAMANISDEDKAKGMEPWMAWKAKNDANIVDMGSPLMGGQSADTSGNWTASTKEVTGYSMVQAENMEAAKAIFEGHPHLSWGSSSSIEVYETVAM